MRIKIILNQGNTQFEKEINNFLANNNCLQIHFDNNYNKCIIIYELPQDTIDWKNLANDVIEYLLELVGQDTEHLKEILKQYNITL